MNDIDEFLSVKEFAKLLRIHPNTVRRAIKTGRINALRVGSGKRSDFRIARSEVNRMSMIDLEKIIDNMVVDKLNSKGLVIS